MKKYEVMWYYMFLCLIDFVLARPEDGYFYQPQQNTGDQFLVFQQNILEEQYKQQQQQELQQQILQFQQPFETSPQLQELELQEIQMLQQQQQQQQQQHQQLQKLHEQQYNLLPTYEKSAEFQQVSEFANLLVQQAHQLVQYEQQELQEQRHQEQKQRQPHSLTENNNEIKTENETFTLIEHPQEQSIQQQQEQQPQREEYEIQKMHKYALQQRQLNNLVPILMEEKVEIQHVPQSNSILYTSAPNFQQIQTIAQPTPGYEAQNITYNKEFFYLTAPNDESDDMVEDLNSEINHVRKNIRVLFIKAPEQNAVEKAVMKLARESVESQTAIYVLTKQHDIGELASQLEQVRGTSHQKKHEVFFVKYKTPEEAEQAQRTIRAQYEAFGGTNNFNNGSSNGSSAISTTSQSEYDQDQHSPEDAYNNINGINTPNLEFLSGGS